MPLLMCPNDNAAMQTVKRNGVEFDICPTCRGVWLDRGELENLMSAASSETAAPQPRPREAERGHERGERGYERRDDDDDGYRQGQPQRKRRGLDIFDIFD